MVGTLGMRTPLNSTPAAGIENNNKQQQTAAVAIITLSTVWSCFCMSVCAVAIGIPVWSRVPPDRIVSY